MNYYERNKFTDAFDGKPNLTFFEKNRYNLIFDHQSNIIINFGFIAVSLILITVKGWDNFYPLLLFIFSIMISHFLDTFIKISITINSGIDPQISDAAFLMTLIALGSWFLGAYIVIMHIFITYCWGPLLFCLIITFGFLVLLLSYYSLLYHLQSKNLPYN
jgi:hypothetical protein